MSDDYDLEKALAASRAEEAQRQNAAQLYQLQQATIAAQEARERAREVLPFPINPFEGTNRLY